MSASGTEPRAVWIARHGNRLDFVRPEWFETAERPYDPPLSDDGIVQACELGDRLASEPIHHLFASPFLRTVQTAACVAERLHLPIKLEWGLCEWLNGAWMPAFPQTLSADELATCFPAVDRDYLSRLRPEYPETEERLYERAAETARQLVAEFSGNLLFVGHGASVLGTAYGLAGDETTIRASLCALVELRQRGDRWTVELAGDTSHLSESEETVRFN